MAEVLNEWPERNKRRVGAYLKFLDGQIWKLTNGVDFDLKNLNSAQNAIRLAASRAGVYVSVRKVSDEPLVIAVQSRPKNGKA